MKLLRLIQNYELGTCKKVTFVSVLGMRANFWFKLAIYTECIFCRERLINIFIKRRLYVSTEEACNCASETEYSDVHSRAGLEFRQFPIATVGPGRGGGIA